MKKKIAFFQNDLDVGGIQKSAVNLMRNMDYDRFDMHLFLSEKQDFWNLDFPEQLHIHYLNPTPRFYSFVPFDLALKHIHYDFPEGILFDLAVDFNSSSRESSSILTPSWRERHPSSNRSGDSPE